jgi:hypothetical protein
MGQVRSSTRLWNKRRFGKDVKPMKSAAKPAYQKPVLRQLEGADVAFGMTTISTAPPSRQRVDMTSVMPEPGPDEPTRRPQAAREL